MRLILSVIQIAKHKHPLPLPPLTLLNKIAAALIPPECCPERGFDVGLIVLAHNFADMDASFASVVERDCGDEVVADVGTDDVVEEVGVDEAEVAVNCCGCAAGEGPGAVCVVWHAGVGMLEECYCDWRCLSVSGKE